MRPPPQQVDWCHITIYGTTIWTRGWLQNWTILVLDQSMWSSKAAAFSFIIYSARTSTSSCSARSATSSAKSRSVKISSPNVISVIPRWAVRSIIWFVQTSQVALYKFLFVFVIVINSILIIIVLIFYYFASLCVCGECRAKQRSPVNGTVSVVATVSRMASAYWHCRWTTRWQGVMAAYTATDASLKLAELNWTWTTKIHQRLPLSGGNANFLPKYPFNLSPNVSRKWPLKGERK